MYEGADAVSVAATAPEAQGGESQRPVRRRRNLSARLLFLVLFLACGGIDGAASRSPRPRHPGLASVRLLRHRRRSQPALRRSQLRQPRLRDGGRLHRRRRTRAAARARRAGADRPARARVAQAALSMECGGVIDLLRHACRLRLLGRRRSGSPRTESCRGRHGEGRAGGLACGLHLRPHRPLPDRCDQASDGRAHRRLETAFLAALARLEPGAGSYGRGDRRDLGIRLVAGAVRAWRRWLSCSAR